MRRLICFIILLVSHSCFVNGQTPSNDHYTYLYDGFVPWCNGAPFEAHHGTPMSHSIMMEHQLYRNKCILIGGARSLGEGIVADFNFMKDAQYTVNVNIASFMLFGNHAGKMTVMLVNNPSKLGCTGAGSSNHAFMQPIPGYSAGNSFILAEHTITSDLTSSKNVQINLKSPGNFNGIVIYPQDLDIDCHKYLGEPAGVILHLNCVQVELLCYPDVDKTYDASIPSGVHGARNFYIGSSFGQNINGIAVNSTTSNTECRATQSLQFEPNTIISVVDDAYFLGQIYPCYFDGEFEYEPQVIISDIEGCDPIDEIVYDGTLIRQTEIEEGEGSYKRDNSSTNQDEQKDLTKILIYPNPAHNVINFSVPNFDEYDTPVQIKIYNLLGKVVLSKEMTKGKVEMDISHIPKGIYICEVTGENLSFKKKILIDK